MTLSDDGHMIHVAEMKWFPKDDTLSLNINELNFPKKKRGKKPEVMRDIVPSKLTRRHCTAKVSEVFDLTGKVAPLTASMKIDLPQLVDLRLDWDDQIPDNLRQIWISKFEVLKEIGNLGYHRAVIPEDAANLDIETMDFGDASQSMVCCCIYARFKRRNGLFSCQLILARTRTVPKGMSQPRAELYAAQITTHTGGIVRKALAKYHKDSMKFTDSQISLHWIHNEEKPLKQWVRNRVMNNGFTSDQKI